MSNTENRKKYDQYGKDWKHAEEFEKAKQQQYQRTTQQNTSGAYFGQDHSGFFESMFGDASTGSRRSSIKFRGQDYNAELHLDLKDVYKTHKRTLTINGKNIRLTIPSGIKNGQVIKIKGHGGKGINDGPNGDLYIKFSIVNQSKFQRDNDNLHVTVNLDLYKAILGGDITIDTFDGKVKLKIKPETQSGTKVKLKGKGFPKYKKEGQYGDLYINYQLKVPVNLTNKEKKLFKELDKLR